MLHILTIAMILVSPFITIALAYAHACKVWASERAAHIAHTVTDTTNTENDATNTETVILLGQCPSILDGTGDAFVILSELGGMTADLGWHDEVGLACQDWVTWGEAVDTFVDSW